MEDIDVVDETVVDENTSAEDHETVTEGEDTAESEGAGEDTPEVPTVNRIITEDMTDEQKLVIATELTELLGIIEGLEDSKKSAVSSFNNNIKTKQDMAHELANKYREGTVSGERECPVEYLWETGVKKVMHPDTGEVLFEDSISDSERQKWMPGFENQVDDSDNRDGEKGSPTDDYLQCAQSQCDSNIEGDCTDDDGSVACVDYKEPVAAETTTEEEG